MDYVISTYRYVKDARDFRHPPLSQGVGWTMYRDSILFHHFLILYIAFKDPTQHDHQSHDLTHPVKSITRP